MSRLDRMLFGGFCDNPRLIDPLSDDEEAGFYIDEYELDKDQWTEGFVTV